MASPNFDGKPVGARFVGMGESGAALGGLPESSVWNPASLIDLPAPLVSADFDVAHHSQLDDDVLLGDIPLRGRKLTYLGFAASEAAFYFRPLASFEEHIVTNPSDPDNNFTQESLKINQFGISVVQETDKKMGGSAGLNISYLNARRGYARAVSGQPPILELADGNGFALDLGFRWRRQYISYGAAVFNIPGIVYWNLYKPDQLPVLARGGLAFHPVPIFAFSWDYEKRFYRNGLPQPDSLHLGLEVQPLPWLQLRAGTYGEDIGDPDETTYTGGFSVASARSHRLDAAVRSYRLQGERVYNTFLSLILPLASKN